MSAASFLRLLDDADPVHQYQLYGRFRAGDGVFVRSAVRYRQRIQDDPEVEVGLRIGVDRVVQVEGAWRFYAGGDLLGSYARSPNGQATYRMGVGPLVGALVYLTRHVSLSAEPRLVATYNQYQQSTLQGETADTVSLGLEGIGLLIVSVHF